MGGRSLTCRRSLLWFIAKCRTHCPVSLQVDVTAAEEIAKPDVVPNIDRDAERTAHSAATVINSALQHMGLGPDPWKGIVAGVGRLKPFTQAGSRSRCGPDRQCTLSKC